MQFIILVINSAGSEDSAYISHPDEIDASKDINDAVVYQSEQKAWDRLLEIQRQTELNLTIVPVRIEIAYPYTT